MILNLKRLIASNKYFWKYRHLMNKNIFSFSYGKIPKDHFNKVFKNLNINSVLDFGCATGDKLQYFTKNGSKIIYGVDINSRALSTAKNKFKDTSFYYEFSKKINLDEINNFLKKRNIDRFDLILVERLFYILNNEEFFNAVNILSKKTKYLYIDDFFLKKNFLEKKIRKKINGYTHTYFDEVFDRNFKKIYAENSPYSKVKFANSGCALYKFIH